MVGIRHLFPRGRFRVPEAFISLVMLAAVACSNASSPENALSPETPIALAETQTLDTDKENEQVEISPATALEQLPEPDSNRRAVIPAIELPLQSDDPFGNSNWKTDFFKHSVPLNEIIPGGLPRDGIPPIDNPDYANVLDSPAYLRDEEPVIAVELNGDARAYPLAILIWHEIVNGEVGSVPVSITFCPLCNSAITFDRRVGNRVLDFGTTGFLRKSDLVMWDRQTESWWQQITGEAIVGEFTGTKLRFIPAPTISWGDFKKSFPDGQVLTRNTGFDMTYNNLPYAGYDDSGGSRPFLFFDSIDTRLETMERIIGLTVDDESVAYPFKVLRNSPIVHDSVAGKELVIFYAAGTLSAFNGAGDSPQRDVGSTGVFDPFLDGQRLTFKIENDSIVDEETGSMWNILGQATSGELEGRQLTPIVHANHFWFAWQAFNPDTSVRTADDISG